MLQFSISGWTWWNRKIECECSLYAVMPKFKTFNRTELHIPSLEERVHDLDLSVMLPLEAVPVTDEGLSTVAKRIRQAKKNSAPIVFMMGAHVLRSGVQRYLIDLMERGYVTCMAMNGACAIHDYEFSLTGQTTESVSKYIIEEVIGIPTVDSARIMPHTEAFQAVWHCLVSRPALAVMEPKWEGLENGRKGAGC